MDRTKHNNINLAKIALVYSLILLVDPQLTPPSLVFSLRMGKWHLLVWLYLNISWTGVQQIDITGSSQNDSSGNLHEAK